MNALCQFCSCYLATIVNCCKSLCALLEPGFFKLKPPLISDAISQKKFLFGFYRQNVWWFDETIGKGEKDMQ